MGEEKQWEQGEQEEDPLVIDEEKPAEAAPEDVNEAEEDENEKEFEPTVDMIMNEFDDERTIDEEETMTQEDEAEELNALKDEQDMPIEELLKMYGYNKDAAKEPAEAGGPSQAAEEVEADPEDDEEEEE